MTANAVRTLCHMCHGDGDQLFGLARQGAIGKHAGAKGLERLQWFGCQILTLARNLRAYGRVERIIHGLRPPDLPVDEREPGSLMVCLIAGAFKLLDLSTAQRWGRPNTAGSVKKPAPQSRRIP